MNRSEFEKFIAIAGDEIYSFCRYLAKDTMLADDLYQDVVLTAYEKCEKISIENNPKSYLLGIAVNLFKRVKHKENARQYTALENYEEKAENKGYVVEEAVTQKEERESLLMAVNALKEKYRTVVILYYFNDCSIEEISSILKVPEGTVKSRLYKAREMIKGHLMQEGSVKQ